MASSCGHTNKFSLNFPIVISSFDSRPFKTFLSLSLSSFKTKEFSIKKKQKTSSFTTFTLHLVFYSSLTAIITPNHRAYHSKWFQRPVLAAKKMHLKAWDQPGALAILSFGFDLLEDASDLRIGKRFVETIFDVRAISIQFGIWNLDDDFAMMIPPNA